MQWTAETIRAMAAKMETRRNGFRVSAATAPLVIDAIRIYAREHCAEPIARNAFSIDVWDRTGNSIEEHLAIVNLYAVAEVAYDAACQARPGRTVTMRQGTRVVRRSDDVFRSASR